MGESEVDLNAGELPGEAEDSEDEGNGGNNAEQEVISGVHTKQ